MVEYSIIWAKKQEKPCLRGFSRQHAGWSVKYRTNFVNILKRITMSNCSFHMIHLFDRYTHLRTPNTCSGRSAV